MDEIQQQTVASGVHDWTNVYKKFENLIVEEDEEKEKKKSQSESNNGMMNPMAGCNHDHSAERAIWEMSWDDKLKACSDFREEGNYFFREAQFGRAADRYHRALVYFEYCIAENDDDEAEYNKARLMTLLNFSICLKRLKKYSEAHNNLRQALDIDPTNVKAMYHKGQIYRINDEYEKSKEILDKALQYDQNNQAIIRELHILKYKKLAYIQNSKEISKTMFSFDKNKHRDKIDSNNGNTDLSVEENVNINVQQELESTDKSWLIMAGNTETKIGENHMKIDTLLSSSSTT